MNKQVTKICHHSFTNNVDFICGYFEKDDGYEKGKPYLCRVKIQDGDNENERRQQTQFISEDEEYTYFNLDAGDEWDISKFRYELTSWECSKITPQKVPVEVRAYPHVRIFSYNISNVGVYLTKRDENDRNCYLCQVTAWDEQSKERRVKTVCLNEDTAKLFFRAETGTDGDMKNFRYKVELQKVSV